MSETILVRPAEGRRVRYPADPRRVLPAEGAEVPAESYWLRRLADGDIELVE